jgi:2-keto-4-pentenoate hydratase
LQKNTAKAELYLKERYEKEIIFALKDKFKGRDQKIREAKFLKDIDVKDQG